MVDSPVDAHLARYDGLQHTALTKTCDIIRAALPGAAEVISYGMPTFKIDGIAVVGLGGFKNHNSLFPYSGAVIASLPTGLSVSVTSKGTVQFPKDEAFPQALLKRLLQTRIDEINAGFPKKSGVFKEFYSNGFLKATGKMRDGEMHGAWRWYRRDGSLMRSGSFNHGVKAGQWTTYDRDGQPYKVTQT